LQTGGSALGEISTKSRLASFACLRASSIETTPIISPSLPTSLTSLAVISLLTFGNLLFLKVVIKILHFKITYN
jgi:hypothetical protein